VEHGILVLLIIARTYRFLLNCDIQGVLALAFGKFAVGLSTIFSGVLLRGRRLNFENTL
jgi:hypothetical protein